MIDGFGELTLDSLVVSEAGVATATIAGSHSYPDHSWITIAGASPAGLNGTYQIHSGAATTFAFTVDADLEGTATGTITAKVAPVGDWEIADEDVGTNRLALRSTHPDGTGMVFEIDDTRIMHNTVTSTAEQRSWSISTKGWNSFTDLSTRSDVFGDWWWGLFGEAHSRIAMVDYRG